MLFALIVLAAVLRGKASDEVIAPLGALSLIEMIMEWILLLLVLT